MKRGDVWWASLGPPRGSSPGYRRPVLIVQSDVFNLSGINSVVVAILTTNLLRGDAPGNVVVSERESGLPHRSVVNVSQLFSVDRSDLTERVGALPARRMAEVDAGLRLVLSLI